MDNEQLETDEPRYKVLKHIYGIVDIHKYRAMKLFDVDYNTVTDEQRKQAKDHYFFKDFVEQRNEH